MDPHGDDTSSETEIIITTTIIITIISISMGGGNTRNDKRFTQNNYDNNNKKGKTFFFKGDKYEERIRGKAESRDKYEADWLPSILCAPVISKNWFSLWRHLFFFLRFFFNYGKIDVYTHRFFPFHSFLFGSPLLLLFFRTTLRSARIHTQKKNMYDRTIKERYI